MRARSLVPGLAIFALLAGFARAEVVNVNVLQHEFSTNGNGEPIEDAVITVGDTIHWEFLDPFHSVTSCAGIAETFDSGFIFSLPASFEHTFTQVGSFHYYCAFHGYDEGNGTAAGMAGVITVLPGGPVCDSVDFNRDELFPDVQDIADFLTVFAGGNCPTDPPVGNGCGDVDFNNDGLFPDTVDIDSLLSVFAGGACL